jgi:hypothetical protein
MYAKKGSNLKVIATLLAIALVIGCGIGGTIALLQDQSGTITNTFTASNLTITLTETKPDNYTAKMVPGAVIEKNPKITVVGGSEDCYVFVKIEKSANFDTFMTFSVAEGWYQVPSTSGVYYREVQNVNANKEFSVLENNQVIVNRSITKADMENITDANAPTLSFTAYAIQSANLNTTNISEIWNMAKGNTAT